MLMKICKNLLAMLSAFVVFFSCVGYPEGTTSVEATVTDYYSGEPIAGASLLLGECRRVSFQLMCNSDSTQVFQTDAEGKAFFTFDEPKASSFKLIPSHDENYFPLAAEPLELNQDEINEIDFRMKPYRKFILTLKSDRTEQEYDSLIISLEPEHPYYLFTSDLLDYSFATFEKKLIKPGNSDTTLIFKMVPDHEHVFSVEYYKDSLPGEDNYYYTSIRTDSSEEMTHEYYLE